MWERVSAALAISRERGWTWRGDPAGADPPVRLVGQRTTARHHDVVLIELAEEPMTAVGARFALHDWGHPGTAPVRGPLEGAPDQVLLEVMDWPHDELDAAEDHQ